MKEIFILLLALPFFLFASIVSREVEVHHNKDLDLAAKILVFLGCICLIYPVVSFLIVLPSIWSR